MVKDVGLAYRETDESGREIYCPICLTYCGGKGDVGIACNKKLHVTKKCVARHLDTTMHMKALQMQAMEVDRQARRNRVGLIVGRAALQTLREGSSYLQFEEKLLNLHLAGLDIGR